MPHQVTRVFGVIDPSKSELTTFSGSIGIAVVFRQVERKQVFME